MRYSHALTIADACGVLRKKAKTNIDINKHSLALIFGNQISFAYVILTANKYVINYH